MPGVSIRRRATTTPAVALSYLLVVCSIGALRIGSLPVGPWEDIYTQLAGFWLFLFAGHLLMLWAVRWRRLGWATVSTFTLIATLAIVSMTLQWGYPFGLHDPWVHLDTLTTAQLNPVNNPYPLFHALLLAVTALTELSKQQVLMGVPIIAVSAGIGFLSMLMRRIPLSAVAGQTLLIVGAPALLLGVIARPFTLAMPFVLVIYWVVYAFTPRRAMAVLAVVLTFPLLWLHPFVAFCALVIITTAFVARLFWVDDQQYRPGWKLTAMLSLLAAAFVVYVAFVSSIGQQVIASIIETVGSLQTQSPPAATDGPTQTQPSLFAKLLTPRGAVEALARLAYVLSLGFAAVVSLLLPSPSRRFWHNSLVVMVAGSLIGTALLVGAVLSTKGITIYRVVQVAPLLVLPLAIGVFRQYSKRPHELLAVGFAVMILIAGLGTAFGSPVTGKATYSATEPQVTGVQWVAQHRTTNIIGTWMTFWIIEGMYGKPASYRWSPGDMIGKQRYEERSAAYSWLVNDQEPDALYVVDRVERTRAQLEKRESNRRQPLNCLHQFRQFGNRIYDNRGTRVYLRGEASVCT
ncbi:hypothetical protein SAMN04487950_0394 [Halogranum rubrum]|uniref:Uncharacterized protein n=1 Tax=Halogranum rubrum TaxID=553466 RepID=A0A1I4BAZ3_9EURY|nr:hypothetical protein [Halogranum rubrum]SFK65199.1 hypothetical protein SAMN04487950_0394 [Halogranum rubrum]